MEGGRAPKMVHYTALVPVQDATDALAHCVERLDQVLRRLTLPYEIICIDDATLASNVNQRPGWMRRQQRLRVIRFDRPRGLSAALSAGIAASRGDLVIGMCPGTLDQPDLVPHLISRLSQFDFVIAQPDRTLLEALRAQWVGMPGRIVAPTRLAAGQQLFFAGRREAVAGLSLGRSAFRLLPEMVARQGWRVCNLTIGGGLPPRGSRLQPSIFRRLVASWHCRRFEPHLASELATKSAQNDLPVTSRTGFARRGAEMPQPAKPIVEQHGKIA